MFENNNSLLFYYIEQCARSLEGFTVRGTKLNFKCNVCGDSKKNSRKTRAWISENKAGNIVFKCFNEGCSMSGSFWLKRFFPSEYKSYIRECLKVNKSDGPLIKKLEEPKKPLEKKNTELFKPILAYQEPLFLKGIEFCKNRKIPEKIWTKFYISDMGKFNGRLIIPFYKTDNSIYYYTGRTLSEDPIKYLNCIGEKLPYNIFNVDKEKPIIVLEGPIDSMFVGNSIAIVGTQSNRESDLLIGDFPRVYYLFDGDEAGKTKSLELLQSGKFVFNWSKFLKEYGLRPRDKWDINEVYLELNREEIFTFNELEKFFTRDIYDKIYFI